MTFVQSYMYPENALLGKKPNSVQLMM